MYKATKDEGFLTRPHYRLQYIHDWDRVWVADFNVPRRARELLEKE